MSRPQQLDSPLLPDTAALFDALMRKIESGEISLDDTGSFSDNSQRKISDYFVNTHLSSQNTEDQSAHSRFLASLMGGIILETQTSYDDKSFSVIARRLKQIIENSSQTKYAFNLKKIAAASVTLILIALQWYAIAGPTYQALQNHMGSFNANPDTGSESGSDNINDDTTNNEPLLFFITGILIAITNAITLIASKFLFFSDGFKLKYKLEPKNREDRLDCFLERSSFWGKDTKNDEAYKKVSIEFFKIYAACAEQKGSDVLTDGAEIKQGDIP